jgi:hypothetical protein
MRPLTLREFLGPLPKLWFLCWLISAAFAVANEPMEGVSSTDTSSGVAVALSGNWISYPHQSPPDQLPRPLERIDGPFVDREEAHSMGHHHSATDAGVSFRITGRITTQRSMVWQRDIDLTSLGKSTHFLLTYRAGNIARSYAPMPVVALLQSANSNEKVNLLDVAEVRDDNRWHTVVGKIDGVELADQLQVRLSTLDSSAELELRRLEFFEQTPRPSPTWLRQNSVHANSPSQFQCLDLSESLNDSCRGTFDQLLSSHKKVMDGAILPVDRTAYFDDIPFHFGTASTNLIRPGEDRSVNHEPVAFAGVATTRHHFEPHGRNDSIALPVNQHVSEAYFVLVAELPPSLKPYANPAEPCELSDIGAFAIELEYDDGQVDRAFPYSLLDHSYSIHRMCGVYAVAIDHTRKLSRIMFCNRAFGWSIQVAAVTVNPTEHLMLPALAAKRHIEPVPRLAPPRYRPPQILRHDDRLVLQNQFYDITISTKPGFSITRIQNRWQDGDCRLSPASGLEVLVDDMLLTGRAFHTRSSTIQDNRVNIVLDSTHPDVPLQATVTLSVSDSPELKTRLTVMNTGNENLTASLRFPVLRELCLGSHEDTWIFFPQYRSVITNQPGNYLSPNDLKFPAQFLDIYNPRTGFGIGLLTRDRESNSLDYGAGKDDVGASAFVQYPADFHRLKPRASHALVDTRLFFHDGDWHRSLARYREWLSSWYQPDRAQPNRWFQNLSIARSHMTKKFYAWSIPIFDFNEQKYLVQEFVEGDTDYLQMQPQLFHLFGWIDLDNGWHGHPNGDFDLNNVTGGLDQLRKAVASLQDDHGIPVSLYTLSDRCFKKSEFGRKHGPEVARQQRDGSLVEDEANWYICPASTQWHEHYASALANVQRQTGVKALYIDVFPPSRNSPCFSTNHGHDVPIDGNRGALALIKEIRQQIPPDVVLWSEYPVHETATQYLDGNIHYYCLNWHTYFSKQYDRPWGQRRSAALAQSICRYAFPGVRQLVFPCGEPNWSSGTKFAFFNGEALYDTSWSLYASPHLDRIRKSLNIQTEYADCFATMNPEPLIPTLTRNVFANKFPTTRTTVWTLYNANYHTVRGPVLRMQHTPGDRYLDAWNSQNIEPTIAGNEATVNLTLHPQSLGCIVQLRNEAP